MYPLIQRRRRVVEKIRTIARNLRRASVQAAELGMEIPEVDLTAEANRFRQVARKIDCRITRSAYKRRDING